MCVTSHTNTNKMINRVSRQAYSYSILRIYIYIYAARHFSHKIVASRGRCVVVARDDGGHPADDDAWNHSELFLGAKNNNNKNRNKQRPTARNFSEFTERIQIYHRNTSWKPEITQPAFPAKKQQGITTEIDGPQAPKYKSPRTQYQKIQKKKKMTLEITGRAFPAHKAAATTEIDTAQQASHTTANTCHTKLACWARSLLGRMLVVLFFYAFLNFLWFFEFSQNSTNWENLEKNNTKCCFVFVWRTAYCTNCSSNRNSRHLHRHTTNSSSSFVMVSPSPTIYTHSYMIYIYTIVWSTNAHY